jgi:hypothetical protein
MTKFTKKEERKLLFAAKQMFSKKALFIPISFSDNPPFPPMQYLARELRLTGNRSVYLTDFGLEHFRNVVYILDRANFFEGMANFSDIANAWRSVLESWLSLRIVPKCADEVINAIADLIAQEVDDHTFVVPLLGIELEGVDSFTLGAMLILKMSTDVLDSAEVNHDYANVPYVLELYKNYLWLKGTAKGTPSVAQQRFSELATLTVGLLAITAGSMYEWGATGFRIGIVMSSEEALGRSIWFSWQEKDRSLTSHGVAPRGQPLPVNKVFGDESDMVKMINRSFAILSASSRTELEEAIVKAVYWYSDAHRDQVLVMKLIKYWSCVEAFFSFEKKEINHAVSAGLASILVYGGFRFVPLSEYSSLKSQIEDLYDLRSQAVHSGSHRHIVERDVAQFSQWVAWMIISMVALVEQGYTTLKQVKAETDRLDGLKTR